MSINDGDHVIVAGVQKTNGLKALAYNDLTNGTYGEGGKSLRIGGIILAIVCLGLGMAFIGIVGFLGVVIPVSLGVIGIWLWWLGTAPRLPSLFAGRHPLPSECRARPDLS